MTWQVELTAGTNLAVAVAPTTGRLAVTVQGAVWLVPPDGGEARPATPPGFECAEAHRASWSPAGDWLAFQTNQDGHYHLWRVDAEGGEPAPLTAGDQDDREPAVSPDGSRVAFASDRTGRYQVWVLDLCDGSLTRWTDEPGEAAMPAWRADGQALAYVLDGHTVRVATADRVWTAHHDPARTLYGPAFTPDGRLSCAALDELTATLLVVDGGAVTELTTGEDVFPAAASWPSDHEVVYAADGHVRRRDLAAGVARDVPFTATVTGRSSELTDADLFTATGDTVRGVVDPVLAPDGARVAFHALGSVWVAELGGAPARVGGPDGWQTGPSWFPDGSRLAYSSDAAGSPDLWQYDLRTGEHRRLTDLPGAQTYPVVGPDGARIAFQDHDDRTYVLDGGRVRQVLPALMQPSRPAWTPAGDTLAVYAHVPASRRFREGETQLLLVDAGTGAVRYRSFAAHGALSGRASGAPAWSPDGTHLAVILDGRLHVVPASGGVPRRLTDHTADHPSWTPDSGALLYLHHGTLRRVGVDAVQRDDVPLALGRATVREPERVELHAGALWDGRGDTVVRDARIVVADGRIVSVEPDTPGDGAGLTALPGLVDMHTHAAGMLGATFGRRLGRLQLAYGITTVRSTGDPGYVAAAAHETYASGAHLGPRFVPTGELLDGVRCFWAMARPVRDEDQLLREIERCHRLGMRFVKVYNRLPTRWHGLVVREAHRRGMRVTSHHLYPGVLDGQDGLEHLVVATNRVTTLVSRLGYSQPDVLDLIARSGLALTPTLFDASVLLHDDPSVVDDERLRTLLPDWAYPRLRDKATAVASADPVAARTRLDRLVASVGRIASAGGVVTTGTDAPLDDVALALHLNLRALVRGGTTPTDALRTVTSGAAAAMGCGHEIGTVEPGRLADLVLVRGDPTTRIEAAAEVEAVVAAGRLLCRADLLALPVAAADTVSVGVDPPLPDAGEHWWHDPSSWDSGAPKQR